MTAASPVMRSLALEDHGLAWAHAPTVLAHVRPDAPAGIIHRDRVRTAAAIDGDPDLGDVGLSPRQLEVLELYASGEKLDRVARLTGLAPQTVNDYLQRIRQKYAEAGRPAPTKTDLYKRAVEDGLLPIPERPRTASEGPGVY